MWNRVHRARYWEVVAQLAAIKYRWQVVVIRTESEYRRLLSAVDELMSKPEDGMTEEEGRLLELLSVLVEEYEDRVRPLPKGQPHKLLAFLLEEKGMKPSDLGSVLPKSRVSEILNGKRAISKMQAKKLSEVL